MASLKVTILGFRSFKQSKGLWSFNQEIYFKYYLHFSNLNNQPEGEYFSFYENGNTESKGAYKEGVMIGNWQYYNYYGEKTEEVFYDEFILTFMRFIYSYSQKNWYRTILSVKIKDIKHTKD